VNHAEIGTGEKFTATAARLVDVCGDSLELDHHDDLRADAVR
jgi:hypothetical protein